MSHCTVIRMDDGTTVLANVKPKAVLTEEDKRVLTEWVQFCRDRRRKAFAKANAHLLEQPSIFPDGEAA